MLKRALHQGSQLDIWVARDARGYGVTVGKMSESEVEVLFGDGTRKRYGWVTLFKRANAAKVLPTPTHTHPQANSHTHLRIRIHRHTHTGPQTHTSTHAHIYTGTHA